MKTLKKALSLTLALALSLALAVPAFAAGTTETVDIDFAIMTITNVVKKETKLYNVKQYDGTMTQEEFTFYVISDSGCTVSFEAVSGAGGRTNYAYLWYAGENYFENDGMDYSNMDSSSYGPYEEDGYLYTNVYTKFDRQPHVGILYESQYAKLVPVGGSATPVQPTDPTTPTQPEQPTQPATPVVPDAPGSYTVKKGDTWSSICTNFYGTNAQRYALQKANKGVKLKEGAVITLPEKLGKAALIPAPVAGEGEKLYTVKAGDTLGKIAAAEYGKVSEYKAVFERNADRLKSANTIYEGQVIVLPAKK